MRSLFPYNLRASFGRRVIAGISRLDRYRAAILGHYETCQTLTRYRVSKFVGTPRPLREVVSQTKFGKSILYLRRKDELFVLVNAHEQRIEAACTGDVTADDELLLHVRAMLDPRARIRLPTTPSRPSPRTASRTSPEGACTCRS